MKTLTVFFVLFLASSTTVLAQNPFMGNVFGPGYYPGSANSTTLLGDAAVTMANGSFLLNQSEANINNQIAYGMSMRNEVTRVHVFYQKRQLGGYYRDIEAWQKQARKELKDAGLYDRDAIEYIYGINRNNAGYNTGYNIPYP